MYSTTRTHCISATACIAAQAQGIPMFIVVFMVAVIVTTLILHILNQTKQNEEETSPGENIRIDIPNQIYLPVLALQMTPQVRDSSCYSSGTSPKMKNNKETIFKFPGKEKTIDIPNSVSPIAYSVSKTPQVLAMSSSSVESSQILADKVESNADQRNLDVSNVDSILHQALVAGQESSSTSSFHIEHPNNLLLEAQTTSAVQNYNTGVASQTAQSPTQATAVTESPAQVPELKTAVRVGFLVIPISAGGIFSVLAGLIENKNTGFTHKVLFKTYLSLSSISFFLGVFLFLLTLMPRRFPRLILIVKITMWTTVGTDTYAIGCAICVILLTSLVEAVLVLVAPLPVIFVLIILSFCSYRN